MPSSFSALFPQNTVILPVYGSSSFSLKITPFLSMIGGWTVYDCESIKLKEKIKKIIYLIIAFEF
jgi:hypothetical protein